jgi:hypothetical protein
VGAGTTAIQQACDRSYLFKQTKEKVRKARKENRTILNELLVDSMREAFAKLETEHSSVKMSANFKNNVTDGLTILMHAYQHTMTPDIVARGFTVCGQHCAPDANGNTVDFDVMMAQCYSDIPQNLLDHMLSKTSDLCVELLDTGAVSWASMNAAGIPTSPVSINRDNLTHIRHSSEIVSHDVVVAKYHAEVQQRDPVHIAEQRAVDAAWKFLAQQDAERTKKEQNALQRQQQKAVEDQRVAQMSKADLLAEKRHKAAVKRADKENKAHALAQREQECRALVARGTLQPLRLIQNDGETSDSGEDGDLEVDFE